MPSDSVGYEGTCILNTTVLDCTLEELNLINTFMIGSEHNETIGSRRNRMVLFFNDNRDTVLVRTDIRRSNETYKMFVRESVIKTLN